VFARLKSEGVIPHGVRFQVSLPTPVAVVASYIQSQDAAQLEPAYERQMLRECGQIQETVPHDQLAVQWDVAVEFGILEEVLPNSVGLSEAAVVERLVRLGNAVAPDVELGYHLCYGDAGHKHFKEPDDTTLLVRVANAISTGLTRPVQWIHLPVPRDRTDETYFAPLADLRLHPETELYLGLVHLTDGVQGTERRIEVARRVVGRFGVGTECGMGRRDPNTIPPLLQIHAEVAMGALKDAGLTHARYVRIIDQGGEACPSTGPRLTNDGFDLDAIAIVNAEMP